MQLTIKDGRFFTEGFSLVEHPVSLEEAIKEEWVEANIAANPKGVELVACLHQMDLKKAKIETHSLEVDYPGTYSDYEEKKDKIVKLIQRIHDLSNEQVRVSTFRA